MMNSSLASPIPSFGIMEKPKASSGFPRFIIILVFGRFMSFRLRVSLWKGRIPSYTSPSSPSAQLTVISLPVSSTSVALPAPTTAGIPSSRLTIAAWQVLPPLFVTIAAAVFITGSQSGVVVSATRISPGLKEGRSEISGITCAFPDAILSPTLLPITRTSDLFSST